MTNRFLQLSLIVLILTTSCSILNLGRKYIDYIQVSGDNRNEIRLNNDSTFVYGARTGVVIWETEGTWTQKDDIIYLTSYNQLEDSDTNSFYVLDRRRNSTENITIDFMQTDSVSPFVGMTSIVYKDNKVIETSISDLDGQSIIKSIDFDSIVCNCIGFHEILITTTKYDYYKFATVEDDKYYRYFKNYGMIRKEDYILDRNDNIKYKLKD